MMQSLPVVTALVCAVLFFDKTAATISCYACSGLSSAAGVCSPPYTSGLGTPKTSCNYCQTFEQPSGSATGYYLTCGNSTTAPVNGCSPDPSTGQTVCYYTCTTNTCIAGPPSTAETTQQSGTTKDTTHSQVNGTTTVRSGASTQRSAMGSVCSIISLLSVAALLAL